MAGGVKLNKLSNALENKHNKFVKFNINCVQVVFITKQKYTMQTCRLKTSKNGHGLRQKTFTITNLLLFKKMTNVQLLFIALKMTISHNPHRHCATEAMAWVGPKASLEHNIINSHPPMLRNAYSSVHHQ